LRHSSRRDRGGKAATQGFEVGYDADKEEHVNGRPHRNQKFLRVCDESTVTGPGPAVFLSYASQDAAAALQLCNALRQAGVEVWFDQSELRGGDAWDASIRRQIKACALFIPIISRHTHMRDEGYFRLEWKLAIDRSHLMVADRPFLLPVVIDDTSDQDEKVPDRFRDVQWTRLPGGQRAEAFVERVRRLLSPDPTTPNATNVPSSASPTASASAASTRSTPAASRSFVPWIVGGLLILVTGYFIVDRFVLPKHSVPAADAPGGASAHVEAISDKSVAVLPFVDMSEKKDQEYFSDGLSEELIDLLTKVAGLRVPARTSSFSFKGKQTTVSDIAKALRVSHVLEGSVRKSGNRLRIVAQLIDARTDAHVWSQNYDRELTDVFAVQDEIAASVVTQLRITLLGAAPTSKTTNPKAYALFLEGLQYGRQYTKEGFQRSISLYEQALAIDSNYAAAWDGLAKNYINQTTNGLRPRDEGTRLAREAANRAISIDPEFASAYARLGSIAARFEGDFVTAAKLFERALALQPSNSTIVGNAASLAYLISRLDTAIALQKYTNARDPLNGIGHENLGIFYVHAGKPDDALAELHAALSLNPKQLDAYSWISRALLLKGDPKAALTAIQQEPDDEVRLAGLAMASYALRQKADSDAALAELIKRGEDASVARVLAFRGEPNRAFEWLEKAASKNELLDNAIATDPDFANLHRDARWLPFLRKIGIAPDQLAPIRFDVKLPE
jgi:TolB-like protein/Flp pilus assembly protein TadD